MINLSDTHIAFAAKSKGELRRAYRLFSMLKMPFLVKMSNQLMVWAMKCHLPVKRIIRNTAFSHFCGGESIEKCRVSIERLGKFNIKTILDYSVEGGNTEKYFEATADEIMAVIREADKNSHIGFTSLKMTGLARTSLLEKLHEGQALSEKEQQEWANVKQRLDGICKKAAEADVPVFIDAEESWMHKPVDHLALEMMRRYNIEKVVVYHTLQMYLTYKANDLLRWYEKAREEGFRLGVKLVRGAYWEKEQLRARDKGYEVPVFLQKAATDQAFNDGLRFCIKHLDVVALCAATHNEESTLLLTRLMNECRIENRHPCLWFSQLYGMSDHISFNLANEGYNVAKYVPYGPIEAVLPYLSRRLEENTSMAGQLSRELRLIMLERARRKAIKAA